MGGLYVSRVCCEQTLLDCGISLLHIISYLSWYTCNVEIWRPDPWCAAFRITLESFRTRSLGMDWHESKLVLYRCLSCILNYQSYIMTHTQWRPMSDRLNSIDEGRQNIWEFLKQVVCLPAMIVVIEKTKLHVFPSSRTHCCYFLVHLTQT